MNDEVREVMESTLVGENHGRQRRFEKTSDIMEGFQSFQSDDHLTDLNKSRQEVGYHGIQLIPLGELGYHGMSAHRGVLEQEEKLFLDKELARTLVGIYLGTPVREVGEIYGSGRPGPERLAKRDALDEVFLELQEQGGNMSALARVLDWHIRENGECRKMSKALARAKSRRG